MKIIVGLGNPGEKYEHTRHNVGFLVLDTLLKEFEPVAKTFWDENKKQKIATKEIRYKNNNVILAKPLTFMNNSGFALSHFLSYHNITPEEMMVVYDDLDLPLGKIRIRFGGAAGGHKGVESIINQLGDDKFLRVRLGIGHPSRHYTGKLKDGKSHIAVEDYVLQTFSASEKSKLRHMTKEAVHSIKLILEHGIDLYMSKYNGGVKDQEE